ncbi:type II toxin-antitoxin system HicB family antitoxin [Phormidesmis priestleyi ULC007]|uniref:Type II toxin-antitoxin system HicB family antitoxin n=1 Tax=Phormidesmis priestleyi ULC007 TaxID=1920490 RepID=A0A2T1DC11_9CYAN|nr:type II toxin-antitoxin system HicB family antitoxin [Phormidesmis priestleyi]PSB18029.1 type II toxin-antitoxin system HicB family antitoxin [Phormidesmis priestleyi ULC007]PZO49369.1 MAG: type II toxin-antitoxin system HicB family antitoxin [Phormidesmis priestleyi]
MSAQYGMVIQWSEVDQCFVVILPDFADVVKQPCTDGKTYQEAVTHGQEVIESLIEMFQDEGKSLPEPKVFQAA